MSCVDLPNGHRSLGDVKVVINFTVNLNRKILKYWETIMQYNAKFSKKF